MKNKKYTIICTAVSLVILIAVIVLALIKANKPATKTDETSSASSIESDVVVEIGNIEETESGSDNNNSDNLSFIEPDETEADKLLNENKKSKDNSKAESAISSSEAEETESVEVQTFEEGKTELEDTADDYLKANKIDPKTAGETGEICPNCGKKIWNPDKYGFFIPGMPDDYENSGYCLGTCGISLE